MKDVHHVIAHKDNILVVPTGLDAVLELNHSSNLINEWSATGASTWERFDKLKGYKKIEDIKPHACHPNFIQKVGE